MAQNDPDQIIRNVEQLIEDSADAGEGVPDKTNRGAWRDARPEELLHSVAHLLERNALGKMRPVHDLEKHVQEGTKTSFIGRLTARVFRLFTKPQSRYNELNLEALNIIGYNLEKMRQHLLRLEERDNRTFGLTGQSAGDFRRLSTIVTDHLRQIYGNADVIQRDIASVTSSLSHVLDHLKGIGESMGALTVNQADLQGEVSSARMELSRLWTEVDMVFESIDARTEDIWKGIGERDAQLKTNTEAAQQTNREMRELETLTREIKARLLVISEQISLHQEMLETLQRRVEVGAGRPPRPLTGGEATHDIETSAPLPPSPAPSHQSLMREMTSMAYSRFQRQYRGDEESLRERQRPYFELLRKHHDVPALEGVTPRLLDLACGDGIFLHLVREGGWEGAGVDLNKSMVNYGRSQGLPIEYAEALTYLENAEERSFTAVTAFQFIEHLPPESLMALLKGIYRVLRPGGLVLTETINPRTLMALRWFHMDLTHERLIFPEVLQVLMETAGFQVEESEERNPVDPKLRLAAPENGETAENVEKLNALLFGNQDYYMLARKPGGNAGD